MKKNNSIGIGVIGCGTVGSQFISHFKRKRASVREKTGIDFVLLKVADRNMGGKKGRHPSYTRDPEEILSDENVDIVVELIGGMEPAYSFIKKAFSRGKSVVTANKALLSGKNRELFSLASNGGVHLGFEASVASAIPIVKTLRESFIGNNITKVMAILNGTTNYILTRMSLHGESFQKALEKAGSLGYAEANPTLDIEGLDTTHKLSILSCLAFNKTVSWKNIFTAGIRNLDAIDINFARDFGYRIKLLAIAKKFKENLELRVHPTFLPVGHMLANVEDVYNAVYMEGDMIGKSLMYGEGAGGSAAASAALADVVDIGIKLAGQKSAGSPLLYENEKIDICSMSDIRTKYYLRFTVPDRPGTLALITDILGKNGISIASVLQKEENRNYAVPVVIMTHVATEHSVQKAVREIDSLSIARLPTVLFRAEE